MAPNGPSSNNYGAGFTASGNPLGWYKAANQKTFAASGNPPEFQTSG